jgi:hypothetical protein
MREREYQRAIGSDFFVREALLSNDIERQKQGGDEEKEKEKERMKIRIIDALI